METPDLEARLAKLESEHHLLVEAIELIKESLLLNSQRLDNLENWLNKFPKAKPDSSKYEEHIVQDASGKSIGIRGNKGPDDSGLST